MGQYFITLNSSEIGKSTAHTDTSVFRAGSGVELIEVG